MSGATHMAVPEHAVMPPLVTGATSPAQTASGTGVGPAPGASTLGLPLGKRGHKRSVSLENNAPLALRSTPSLGSMGSPLLQLPSPHSALHTGTLKSRQEQRRLSQKFGSHSNLDDGDPLTGPPMRSKFQNIRQMFEMSRSCMAATGDGGSSVAEEALQSLPAMLGQQAPAQPTVRRTTPIAAGSCLAISEQQPTQSGAPMEQQHGNASNSNGNGNSNDSGSNFLRPIAFKPIPFEPDYRIAAQQQQQQQQQLHLHQQQQQQQQQQQLYQQQQQASSASMVPAQQQLAGERYGYGSTPSLVPLSTSATHKFGSTTDLRHLAARRRGHRVLHRSSNEDALGLGLTLALGLDCLSGHDRPDGASSKGSAAAAGSDLTPSPSDSGISELEAALKDRDSELSYLRQAMEQNEKVIFKVQKDKEVYWEHEIQRLKLFYESQQREYQLKFKKMEQLLALQQFQLKQHKLRQSEQLQKLQQQLDLTRCNNKSLKCAEQQLQCSALELGQQLNEAHQTVAALRLQLEDSEWKVCERNGEIALLKTQLKEAHLEINMKDHAIVSLRHSNNITSNNNITRNNNNNCKTTTCQSQPKQQQSEELEREREKETEREQQLQQLNKIIALKDQVIGALTNELAKLRKELSDLAIAHEYGKEPCGRYRRLKQQLDNLNEICQKTRKYTMQTTQTTMPTTTPATQLDAIMERLQLNQGQPAQQTLDTLIEESTTYAEDIAKLRHKLDDFRINLELEKRQWCAEKDKVLGYQKQLQAHYIHMYQKLRCLDKASNGNTAVAPVSVPVALTPTSELS